MVKKTKRKSKRKRYSKKRSYKKRIKKSIRRIYKRKKMKGGMKEAKIKQLERLKRLKQMSGVLKILRSGKVYNLRDIEFKIEWPLLEIKMDGETVRIAISAYLINREFADILNLELVSDEESPEKLPLVLKIIKDEQAVQEIFFSKIFSLIPCFREYMGDSIRNCAGIMQSKYLGKRYIGTQDEGYEVHCMLLESGIDHNPAEDSLPETPSSAMNLGEWIRKNKDIDEEEYVVLANKIIFEIISQVFCLQEYGVFHVDIASKKIVVLQEGDNIRVMLIDTGGFVYHIPTFKSKIENESDGIPEKINRSIDTFMSIHVGRDNNNIMSEQNYVWPRFNIIRNKFPSSLCPLFFIPPDDPEDDLTEVEVGFFSPLSLEDGLNFNIFAVSLLANEIACRSEDSHGQNFNGLCWRGYSDTRPPPEETEETEIELLREKTLRSSLYVELIDLFLKNMDVWKGEKDVINFSSVSPDMNVSKYLEDFLVEYSEIANPE